MLKNKSEKKSKKELYKDFIVLSVCRSDILDLGIDDVSEETVMQITDEEMRDLADNIAEEVCEKIFFKSMEKNFRKILSKKNKTSKKKIAEKVEKCPECGRVLEYFYHNCPETKCYEEIYGCPLCDDICGCCLAW